jgi:Zn-dependent protease
MDSNIIQKIAVFAIPLIFALTMHAAAQAHAARYFGDDTAQKMGRLTWNPIKYIDPIWTVVVPLITIILTPFVFGGAKPAPINYGALRNPKRDSIWVAAAGPLANLAMMIAWALLAKMAQSMPQSMPSVFLFYVGQAGIMVNLLLTIFNLFPLPPLDGGRIVAGLLPNDLAYQYSKIEPYGVFIMIGLILTGVLGRFISPLVDIGMKTVYSVFGIA